MCVGRVSKMIFIHNSISVFLSGVDERIKMRLLIFMPLLKDRDEHDYIWVSSNNSILIKRIYSLLTKLRSKVCTKLNNSLFSELTIFRTKFSERIIQERNEMFPYKRYMFICRSYFLRTKQAIIEYSHYLQIIKILTFRQKLG